MSQNKSLLLKKLKSTLAVALPVIAISGFVPTALTVGVAHAEGAKSSYAAEAKAEAEQDAIELAECKEDALAEDTAEAQAEGVASCDAEAKAEAADRAEAHAEAEAEGKT